MCDPEKLRSNPACLVYSVGSNNEFSWESAILNIAPHCEIHVFDHTVSHATNKPATVHFHSWGLSTSTEVELNLFSLLDIVNALNHKGRTVDIFKIDCEGCEWNTFQSWFKAGIVIDELLVEVHAGTTQPSPDPVAKTFMQFMWDNSMLIYHKEPNIMYSQGENLCVEFAFIRHPTNELQSGLNGTVHDS